MAKDKTLYTEDSIESLSPLEFTRLRPGVYAGDTTYSTQLVVEILSNAVDEFRLGHGDTIKVGIKGTEVSVSDNGQGFIPNSFRDDGKTILEAAFSVLNTSGKYREDGTYEGTSLGSFGIGCKITTFLSHYLYVNTYRDGMCESIKFKEGVFEKRDVYPDSEHQGTYVGWQASEEFFTHPEPEVSKLKSLFKTITCLCPGLHIYLNDNGDESHFYSEAGLNDLVDASIGDKEIINNRMMAHTSDGKYKMDFILTYTSNYSLTIVPYVNTGLTEKGPHITQIKTLITREFNKFFKEQKWLKEKDDNLTGDDISEGMYIVFNLTAPNVGYDAQVKTNVTKIEMNPFTTALTDELRSWLEFDKKEIKVIFDKAINARKAREAAKKAKDAVRGVETKDKKKKMLNLPTKLVDANTKARERAELYIVEGDSAAGGLVKGRNSDTQAVFPIRGKIINTYKATIDKIYANQEVNNIVKALGLEVDKSGKLIYDSKKLRYGKIVMAADADPDGQAIKNLLITLFWWLCPDIILNGHLYAAIPPLFRVTTRKNKYIFLRDKNELEAYKDKHQNEKYVVTRNKG